MKRLNNKQKNTIIIVGLLIVGFVCGIATGLSRKNREDIIKDQNIIYKSTISPNEDFVENEKDKPFAIGIGYAIRIEQIAGYYECSNCHYKYIPTYKSVLLSMHVNRIRKMKCPNCNKKSWQKKL